MCVCVCVCVCVCIETYACMDACIKHTHTHTHTPQVMERFLAGDTSISGVPPSMMIAALRKDNINVEST